MSQKFWNDAIIPIFFIYGLAFYSMGLALLVESGRASQLGFARSMRLLAGFGLLHGIHEWLDMFEWGLREFYDAPFPEWLQWFRLSLLVTSFIALLSFGEHLRKHKQTPEKVTWPITMSIVAWYAFSCIIVKPLYNLENGDWEKAIDVLARYIISIPGAWLACLALWQQRAIFRERDMGRFVRDLTQAALAFALYGFVGQIFTQKSVLFPSTFINAQLFQDLVGFPVQLFRAVMAVLVAISMIRVLRALEVENEQRLAAIEEEKIEAERHNHEELTRLNAELKQANQETSRLLEEVQRRDALRGELLHHITAAQEAERKRIARELHDGTGQALTGLSLGLRGLINRGECDFEKLANYLKDLEGMATTSLGELRLLINDMRPPQLDDMGLAAALRWLTDRFNGRGGVEVKLQVEGEPTALPSDVETMLFRIAQECLTNVIKHAHATVATIRLDFNTGPSLTIQDNGMGFDVQSVLEPGAFRTAWGLVGMQERASLINATLWLNSTIGHGTTLTISLNNAPEKEQMYANPRVNY